MSSLAKAKRHSHIGASSCSRWIHCPGSVRMEEGAPPQVPNVHASAGTVAHHIAEDMLQKRYSSKELREKWLGKSVKQDGFEIPVTEEMLEGVEFYVFTIIIEYRRIFREELGVAEKAIHYSFLHVEQRFNLRQVDIQAFGTCDCNIAIPFHKLIVYDYKSGYHSVEVKENEQMMYYGLGALEEHGEDFEEIELHIIQPGDENGVTHKTWKPSLARMHEFRKELIAGIAATRNPNAPLCAGEWCKYCQGKLKCPEQKKTIDLVLQEDFGGLAVAPSVFSLTPEWLGKTLPKLFIVEEYISSLRSYAKSLAESGVKIDGYKLIDTWSNRQWKDEKAIEDLYSDKLDKKLYTTPKLISPAQLEKLIGKEAVKPLAQKVKTGTKLVPETDDRESIKSDFE